MLVSVDPGTKAAGVAFWLNQRLIHACLISGETSQEIAAKIVGKAFLLRPRVMSQDGPVFVGDLTLAMEFPQAYRGSPVNPNDLIALSFSAGMVAYALNSVYTLYLPRVWKGNARKEDMVEKIKKGLQPEELKQVDLPKRSLAHNVWDGVGIGLYHLGRLQCVR